MNKLRRPSQAELDRMSHAEKDALILKLFDLLDGSAVFCVIRSVWGTNKRQGVNPFHTLRLAFAGAE